jgi:thiamine biosynthesis lipoprotein
MRNSKFQIPNFNFYVFYIMSSVFIVFLLVSGCTKEDRMYKESRIVMDTVCSITVLSNSRQKAAEAIEAGFHEIKKLEQLINFYSTDSEITAINRASGSHPVQVSRETMDIVKKAIEIAEFTEGVFDPTIGPLIKLWGFAGRKGQPAIPREDAIIDTLKLIDYKKIKINEPVSEIFLEQKGMEIDLGGIAKGYAADRAIESIKAQGIKAALVAVAGDIKAFGVKENSHPWKVGVQNPRGEKKEEIIFSLHLRDRAISTSGDYQRFFIERGKRYHHIINPVTGYPATEVMSVSVISSDGYVADSLSTAVFILGPRRGIEFLESARLDGVIIDIHKKIFFTKNLKGSVTVETTI